MNPAWDTVKLKEIAKFRTGKLDSNAAVPGGQYPFFTCSPETFEIDSYAFDTTAILLAGNNANGKFPIKYYTGKFNCYQRTYVIENNAQDKLVLPYLYFALQMQLEGLRSISVGAATKFLTKTILDSLKIPLPSLPIQQKIAGILSAYDDLIENNLKRIKLLEELAQITYEEWFVRLRFPGHESTTINSETNLPEGWKCQKFSKHVDLLRGVEPGSSSYEKQQTSNSIPFLRVGDLSKRNSEIFIRASDSNDKICRKEDVLLSLDGSPGLVRFGMSGAYSSGIRKAVIKNDLFSPVFVYCYLNSAPVQFLIEAHATGTTILHAGSSVKYMKINCPPKEILECFNKKMNPCFKLILTLLDQNKALTKARDILLPRLMTGMIDVESYDPAQLLQEAA